MSSVLPEERFLFRPLTNAPGFYRAVARYGCAESRNLHLHPFSASMQGSLSTKTPGLKSTSAGSSEEVLVLMLAFALAVCFTRV